MRQAWLNWVFWPLLAILLVVGGALMYRACGLNLFGFGANYCDMGRGVERSQIAALTLTVRQLESQLAMVPQCTSSLPVQPGTSGLSLAPAGSAGERSVGGGAAASGGREPAPSAPLPSDPATGTASAGGAEAGGGTGAGTGAQDGAPSPSSPPPQADGSLPTPPDASADGAGAAETEGDPGEAGNAVSGDPPDADGPAPADDPVDAPAAPPTGDPPTPEDGAQSDDQAANDCPTDGNQPGRPLVLALDHSKSMGLPAGLSDRTVAELDAQIASADETAAWGAQQIYDGYVASPGRKRLDELKDAVRQSVVEPRDIGIVTFAGCEGGIRSEGPFDAEGRDALLAAVDGLATRPATPLADAIRQSISAARDIGQDGTRILLVSDGIDTCGGDACAAAREAGGIPIDVLTIGDASALACVAEATGGRQWARSDSLSLAAAMAEAFAAPGGAGC